jgi:hypothetical protein
MLLQYMLRAKCTFLCVVGRATVSQFHVSAGNELPTQQ